MPCRTTGTTPSPRSRSCWSDRPDTFSSGWVTFFLIKTEKGGEVPARTALGANSILSIVNIGFGGKSRPPVGYATALDMYIILCFVSCFGALCEFAVINFTDLFVKRRKIRIEEEEAKKLRLLAKREAKVVPKLVANL